jgi:hypothetical protein
MFTRISLCLLAAVLLSCSAVAQLSDKVGTAGFQFLKLGVGARETALGDAAVAFVRGPGAMFWNAAGIATDERASALFFHNQWIAGIRHNYVAVTTPLTEQHFVGIAVNLLGMDDMEETTIDQPQGTGRRFTAGDLAVSGSYAFRVTDRFTAGVSAKYVREYIWDMAADGWAFDVGMLYVLDQWRLGVTFKDFGTDKRIQGAQLESDQEIFQDWDTSPVVMSLAAKSIRLPMSFHAGVAYEVMNLEEHQLSVMGNISYFYDIGEKENLGVEYTYLGLYSLRAGYKFKRDLVSLTGGLGVRVDIGGVEVGADFAVLAMEDFGTRSQFDLVITF